METLEVSELFLEIAIQMCLKNRCFRNLGRFHEKNLGNVILGNFLQK